MHAHPYSVMSGNWSNIVAKSNRVNPTGFVPPKLHFNIKYICVSISHYLTAHLCLAVHTFPQLDIQLKFRFSKSLSQQLLPLHRPQLSLQFLFIQIILSPAVHCPSIAQEGHFKSLSLHSWITGQEKSILTLRLNIMWGCVQATRSLHDEVPGIWFTSWPLFFLIFLQLLLTLLLLYFSYIYSIP